MGSLAGACLALLRSVLATLFLAVVLFATIHVTPTSLAATGVVLEQSELSLLHRQQQQSPSSLSAGSAAAAATVATPIAESVLFSVYCAVLVLVSYSLSRQSSNVLKFIGMLRKIRIFGARSNKKTRRQQAIKRSEPTTTAMSNETATAASASAAAAGVEAEGATVSNEATNLSVDADTPIMLDGLEIHPMR